MTQNSKLMLKPDTPIEKIRSRVGKGKRERIRSGQGRRLYLDRMARMLTGLSVQVAFVKEGASCEDAPEGYHADFIIRIPTEVPDQIATNLPGEVWDLVFQEAEIMHELGHVLYTDFEAFRDRMDSMSHPHFIHFKPIWNVLEDGAIERGLAREFRCRRDLHLKNANLMPAWGIDGEDRIMFWQAVSMVLMDFAKFNTGYSRELFDPANERFTFADEDGHRKATIEALPVLGEYAEKVVAERDGGKRIELAEELFYELLDLAPMGFTDYSPFSSYMEPDVDADGPERGAGKLIPVPGGEGEADEDDDDDGELGSPASASSVEQEKRGEIEANYSEDDGDEMEKECKSLRGALASIDSEVGIDAEVVIPEPGEADMGRYQQAKNRARHLTAQFKRALQAERESEESFNRLSGSPDLAVIHRAEMGNPRVWKSESEPNEKDYTVMFVIDRSGSMGKLHSAGSCIDNRDRINNAEIAVGSMVMALQELGVRTEVFGLRSNITTLEIPFGGDVDDYKDVLFSGSTGGGSAFYRPLSVIRQRMKEVSGERFAVFVADGDSKSLSRYISELDKCTFPVLGVFIGDDVNEDVIDNAGMFHAFGYAPDPEDTGRQVKKMVSSMIL